MAGLQTNLDLRSVPELPHEREAQPDAMNLKAGTRYRFRLFNLARVPARVSLNAAASRCMWRAVAKDGYPLPASQATASLRC